ncbi:gas vesicle protein GvpG [Neorhodopirellula pilleata]|nr:hypothetical protein [Neorhodopirellula pilleata]
MIRLSILSLTGILLCGVARSAPNDAETQMVIVVGAGGTDSFEKQFSQVATQLEDVAQTADMVSQTIGASDLQDDKKTIRDRLQEVMVSVKRDGERPLWIVLIGHGTFTRGVAKFNLTGPDVSADELNDWLEPIERPIVLINTSSASAPFINALSKKGRTIVTATQSGNEVNTTRFAEFFAKAIADPKSDLDHDDAISVFESVLAAASQTKQSYQREDRLATEHALIDDNGDGLGTPILKIDESTTDPMKLDGRSARRISISLLDGLKWSEEQLAERAKLESHLEELRQQKADLDEAEYERQLEQILLKIAKLYRSVHEPTSSPQRVPQG